MVTLFVIHPYLNTFYSEQLKFYNMKKFILLLLVVFSVVAGVAQKSKLNAKSDSTLHGMYTCPLHPNVKSRIPGKCTECGRNLQLSQKEKMKSDVMKMYSCPLHASVQSSKPGKCPECGMDLVLVKDVKPTSSKGHQK